MLHYPNSGLYIVQPWCFFELILTCFPKGDYNPLKVYISTLTIKNGFMDYTKKLYALQEIQLNKRPNQVFFSHFCEVGGLAIICKKATQTWLQAS
jgi:hypothetical protein